MLLDLHCFVAPPAQEVTAALLADASERMVKHAVVAVASLARPRPGVARVEVQRLLATGAADVAGVVHAQGEFTDGLHVLFVVGQLVRAAHQLAQCQYY